MKKSLLVHLEQTNRSKRDSVRVFWQQIPDDQLKYVSNEHLSHLCLLALQTGWSLRGVATFKTVGTWQQIVDAHTDPLQYCVLTLRKSCTAGSQKHLLPALSWVECAVLSGMYGGEITDVETALECLNTSFGLIALKLFRRIQEPPVRGPPALSAIWLRLHKKWNICPLAVAQLKGGGSPHPRDQTPSKVKQQMEAHKEEADGTVFESSSTTAIRRSASTPARSAGGGMSLHLAMSRQRNRPPDIATSSEPPGLLTRASAQDQAAVECQRRCLLLAEACRDLRYLAETHDISRAAWCSWYNELSSPMLDTFGSSPKKENWFSRKLRRLRGQ